MDVGDIFVGGQEGKIIPPELGANEKEVEDDSYRLLPSLLLVLLSVVLVGLFFSLSLEYRLR